MSTDWTDAFLEPTEAEDIVQFAFKDGDDESELMLQARRSILFQASPVFRSMFDERWKTGKVVDMADDVTFDQFEMFKLFLKLVYGFDDYNSLPFLDLCEVYFYAHKYQAEQVLDKLRTELERWALQDVAFNAAELKCALDLIQLYQLEEFKTKMDKVTLQLDVNGGVEMLYNQVTALEMSGLERQVVDFLMDQEPNDEWPYALRSLHSARKFEMFRITVLWPGFDTFQLSINSKNSVKKVKAKIGLVKGIPSEQLRLVFGGVVMDDDRTLYSYHVRKGSTVALRVKAP